MKRISTFLLLSCSTLSLYAQDFAGFRTSNYAGVNSVFSNPANIADSRYRWDVNLVSLNVGVSNNQLKYSLGDVGNAFGEDTLKSQLFGQSKGLTRALVNVTVNVPSFMFNVGKMSFAVTSRARVVANVTDIDGKLADKVMNDFSDIDPDAFPYTLASNSNMRIALNAWSEYGVSAAREVISAGPHFLKAGVTLKYLAGAGSGSINIDRLHATMDVDEAQQDTYLTNASGRIGMNFSGINMSDFKVEDVTRTTGRGFGADLGLVYEYRPDSEISANKGLNKYKFRFGLSLVDFGKIKYEKDMSRSGSYAINIPANQNFYMSSLEGVQLDNYNTELAKYPQYFTADSDNSNTGYSISLPTTLQLDGDYHIHHSFYVNVGVQLALTSGENKPYNTQYYSGFSITPRYDGRIFGFFLPVSYNALTKMNAGASVRVGPLFFGSGSVLSALFGSSHQVDGFLGIRFGGLQKRK
ncbi:DUF5723 family protein [Chitinophaga sp. MM2321]|uniref:DUF5723 family protein n=1 Tax=Chitinophaga sp. MM2321 TaxID=3137178 RepID=UPI0032D5AE64